MFRLLFAEALSLLPVHFHRILVPLAWSQGILSQKQLEGALQRSARLINIAKKPVIYAGQGVIALPEGPKLLKELADKTCIPVTTTVQGLGGFDELDEKSLHMLGMHGSPYANMAIQDADLVIALGARFDDRVTGNGF